MAGIALATAVRTWCPRLGGFGAWLFASVRAAAQDLARTEDAQEWLRRELPAPDRGAQERIAGLGQELRSRLARVLTRRERLALDLLAAFDGDRARVGAVLRVSRQQIHSLVRAMQRKARAL